MRRTKRDTHGAEGTEGGREQHRIRGGRGCGETQSPGTREADVMRRGPGAQPVASMRAAAQGKARISGRGCVRGLGS